MSVEIRNISKEFLINNEKKNVLDNVNITFKDGEFVCILGPSGCGKSTLLSIIAGLDNNYKGEIFVNGKQVFGTGVDRAVVFQEPALFPWIKVIDNVEFGMKVAKVPKEERRKKALKYLKMVHLSKFKDSYVHQLSGGMKQRVSIARALSLNSEVLLMDEPFSALDSQTKELLQLQLQNIWLETKKTIIFITHNIDEAILLGDRVIVMSANPGRVKSEFKIELAHPRDSSNVDLVYIKQKIQKDLKEEVEKVAKGEYDSDWNIEEGKLLCNSTDNMGAGI